jgi:hypothetical protein
VKVFWAVGFLKFEGQNQLGCELQLFAYVEYKMNFRSSSMAPSTEKTTDKNRTTSAKTHFIFVKLLKLEWRSHIHYRFQNENIWETFEEQLYAQPKIRWMKSLLGGCWMRRLYAVAGLKDEMIGGWLIGMIWLAARLTRCNYENGRWLYEGGKWLNGGGNLVSHSNWNQR